MGILRALGVSGLGVLALVLGRAVLTGLVGAVLGIVAGTIAGACGADVPWQKLVLWTAPCAVLAAAPVLSVLAAWIPALVACQIDPAVALREE
jgi:ABC-type antimicrobial peptide transport system permease subunit